MNLIKDGKLGHLWSTDGRVCMWCDRSRTPEEAAVWRAAGEPFERCPGKDEEDNKVETDAKPI